MTEPRLVPRCEWCNDPIDQTAHKSGRRRRSDIKYCSGACRVAAWESRNPRTREREIAHQGETP